MNLIPHLYLHSVAPKRDLRWYKSFLTVEMHFFEKLVQFLLRKKHVFITLDEYLNNVNKELSSKYHPLCLSFDDGYLDNYVFVYPLLKKYKIKATVFVNPDYVQSNDEIRQTLDDVWAGNCRIEDIDTLGFASWRELSIMQNSGIFDVQSHTMTHTKYFVSDKIIDFHNPGADYLYPISNVFPDKKPYYMTDKQFKYLLPFGTPFFEEKSSLICKKVVINQQFIDESVELLKHTNEKKYSYIDSFKIIEKLYNSFKDNNTLIIDQETNVEYEKRAFFEIFNSKRIIEEKLQKPVLHCCWPHGDYNEFCHQIAMNAGYKTTTIVLKPGEKLLDPARVMRNGFASVKESVFLSNQKANYKINSFSEIFPYNFIQKVFYKYKYNIKY